MKQAEEEEKRRSDRRPDAPKSKKSKIRISVSEVLHLTRPCEVKNSLTLIRILDFVSKLKGNICRI